MRELQFKVASLIPTLLNGFQGIPVCDHNSGLRLGIPEGEGLLPPSPSGRGNEGEGTTVSERG
jgi:hypothetical protein